MNEPELRLETSIEFDHLRQVVRELEALRQDVGDSEPTLREKAAAGAFLAQFYTGVENVLKRVSKYHDVPLPSGPEWHVALFRRFCEPPARPLPLLFDEILATEMRRFRSFRHLARTSYGIELDWAKMAEGIDRVGPTFERFRKAVSSYLAALGPP